MIGKSISHYKILSELGRGGMGIVYEAEDPRLDRKVAIKVLPLQHLATEDEKKRFRREAHAAASLNHPGIATVFELDEADGRSFIVMEYIDGVSLRERIESGSLDPDEAAKIAQEIADALAAAHAKGIVHRDIKPANVMLTENGHVKILDFGLAKEVEATVMTKSQSTLGTVPYMSPEQVCGESVDWRADAWSLGAVLYEMLSGRRAYDGPYEAAVSYRILNEDPPALGADIPAPLASLVYQLLDKDPEKRCGSMAEVADALRRPEGASGEVFGAHVPTRTRRWAGRTVTYAAVSILIAAGALFFVRSMWRSSEQKPTLRPNTIAILPFEVQGDTSLEYLGSSVPEILGTFINGAGDLAVIDHNVVRTAADLLVDDRVDIASARAVANEFEAAEFIIGRVRKIGDSFDFNASIYDERDELVETVEIENESDLREGIQRLRREILMKRYPHGARDLERTAIALSENPEALSFFLRGQEELRRNVRAPGADSLFVRAVQEDSTFALAWFRLAVAQSWGRRFLIPQKVCFERARQFGRDLPERERKLIEGFQALADGDADRAEEIFLDVLESNPFDAFTMGLLGDVLYHFNSHRGRLIEEARSWLERAERLAPGNDEYRTHLLHFAQEEEDWDYMRAYYANGTAEDRECISFLARLASDNPDTTEAAVREYEQNPRCAALDFSLEYLEDFALTERLARIVLEKAIQENGSLTVVTHLISSLIAQGRIDEAFGLYESMDPLAEDRIWRPRWEFVPIAMVLPIHHLSESRLESMRQKAERGEFFGGDDPAIRPFNIGLTAWYASDLEVVDKAVDELDQIASDHPEAEWMVHPYGLARRLEALAAFTRGEYDRVLLMRNDRWYTGWDFNWATQTSHVLNTFVHAEALYRLGRMEEALAFLNGLGDGLVSASVSAWPSNRLLAPSYRLRAMMYDELGDEDNAIYFYEKFVDLWQNADDALQPMVLEARQRLGELLIRTGREPGGIVQPS